jgi:hypothetical protein
MSYVSYESYNPELVTVNSLFGGYVTIKPIFNPWLPNDSELRKSTGDRRSL